MKRSLMVFASISAFVLPALAPVATLAQEQDSRGSARGERHNRERPAETSSNDASAYQRRERASEVQRQRSNDNRGQSGGGRGGGGDRSESRPDRSPPQVQSTPQTQPDRSGGNGGRDRNNRPDRGGADNGGRNGNTGWNGANRDRPGQDRPGSNRPGQDRSGQNGGWNSGNGNGRPDRPNEGRPGNNGGNNNGGWNGNGQNRPGSNWNNGGDRNRDRDRQRSDYRRNFDSNRWQQNWNRSHRSDWWRSDNRFRGWSGVRSGFYFAPGYGYYSVPRSYYGRTYREGEYLPSIFWRYSVNDYRTYGLGYPPEGTRWVYVDNAIYLIDAYDGYIIDVIRDAWRW